MKDNERSGEAARLDAQAQRAPTLSEAQSLMFRANRLRRSGAREAAPLPVLRN